MAILAVPAAAAGSQRQCLVDDMTLRRFSLETQRNYIRDVGRLATFLRRSPGTATGDVEDGAKHVADKVTGKA